ncbi:aromatic-ring-hydroxylating dioxygenase subunit beta [uncultured Methylibium sp.]|uniref:aromatic-ring-hydroxylating dioxygenase subunit beta n=1 Tax=uncultured Methylibium sp. TaxID=381093 RepID=UPI0025E6E173|nr:aromatic-ring-hydroxylating dioxygenase subunit beta [uncultured Methylibium sp.]
MSMVGFEDWQALHQLHADHAATLDHGDLARWPDHYTEDAVYRLQSRENFDRGLPLAIMAYESRGMLRDRVVGVVDTIYHDPYSQCHIVGLPRITAVAGDAVETETPLLVLRTKRDAMPETLLVGRSIDRVVRTPEGWRFASRVVVYDNDLIPNSIIDPV